MADLYRCGTLIDGRGGPPVRNAAILVDSGRIARVMGPGDGISEFISHVRDERPDIRVVDLSDYTVLPGLIDMHVHVDYWYSHPNRAEYEDETGDALAACLAARTSARRWRKASLP